MALAAQQIADAIGERLKQIGDVTIYTDRSWPLDERKLPAWKVTTETEDIEALTMHRNSPQAHTLTINARGIVVATDDIHRRLNDEMAAPALRALFHNPSDASLAPLKNVRMRLVAITRNTPNDANGTVGSIDLQLELRFSTVPGDPETIL